MNFEAIIENCTAGICVIQDDKIVYSNKSFSEIFQCSSDDILKKKPSSLLKIGDIYKDRTDVVVDTKIGDNKQLRCTVMQTTWDNKPATQISVNDMSKEKEYIKLLETVTNNIRIGLWQADSTGTLTYVNEYFCDIMERDKNQCLNKKISRLLSGLKMDDPDEVQTSEIEVMMSDGVTKWVKITFNNISEGFVGTITDISTSKMYLPELIKLREDIKQEKI